MCGIFGVINDSSHQAAQTVLAGLKKLEYRGYDSWGIAAISSDSKEILIDKHIGKIGQAETDLASSDIAFGHTRWATHGGVTDVNAHPHVDCSHTISVIHNGIVENYIELKNALLKKNHQFNSETDTEVIAHLIEEKMKELPFDKAVFEVFDNLAGSNAIGVINLQTKSIIICRNGSPLVIGIGSNEYFLASDVTPFLDKTSTVYFMDDQEAVIINDQGCKLYDLNSKSEKEMITQEIDWKVEDAEKGGYPHFMLKEIMEQKITIPKTTSINHEEIQKIAEKIKEGKQIVMTACGTAAYCTTAAKYFFANVGIASQVYGAYEFLPFAKFCNSETIFIAVSQSGETADTLIAVKEAKKNGAYIVAVVNARGSTLERLADSVLSVGAGPEIAVVSTKAFTSQLATLYQLAYACVNKYDEAQNNIKKLGTDLSEWLNDPLLNKVINLSKTLMDSEDIYLIGKHLNYPATLECSLKIKESSYIHSEAFAAGELKHGVITLIKNGTPCIVLASDDEIKQEVLSSAAELKARGGRIIGISPMGASEFDEHIQTLNNGDLTIFSNIIIGQLMGYYLGVGRGTDPDKPRNLAKSVTVK
ncbi:MAG TPA: glutamine--fructose-6-phosphate transaminase (isomerizing) [Candidatus Nitrosocosmicus sp.]|nr:glutamine--fructose-6-phosphate transaminase (isomerizing) [Candidatus Nitrosocosmicus sp.]